MPRKETLILLRGQSGWLLIGLLIFGAGLMLSNNILLLILGSALLIEGSARFGIHYVKAQLAQNTMLKR